MASGIQAVDAVRDELPQPAVRGGACLSPADRRHGRRVVIPGSRGAAHDDAVVEHDRLVEASHVDAQRVAAGRDAEERQDPVGSQGRDRRLQQRRCAGALEDDVEGPCARVTAARSASLALT